MVKIIKKITFLSLVTFFCTKIYSNSYEIVVDVSEQRLYLKQFSKVVESFPISTSKYGEGSIENSFKTPLGFHEIKEKIGDNVLVNTIFVARNNTGKVANIIKSPINTESDHVTSRILWLNGLESGINNGTGVDSYSRYIYIHGTPYEDQLGWPSSAGCIRMSNQDVIELFNKTQIKTQVNILP